MERVKLIHQSDQHTKLLGPAADITSSIPTDPQFAVSSRKIETGVMSTSGLLKRIWRFCFFRIIIKEPHDHLSPAALPP